MKAIMSSGKRGMHLFSSVEELSSFLNQFFFRSFIGRNFSKPIAICVSEIRDVFEWGDVTVPLELLNRLLPGPVTLAFERKPELNQEFNPGKFECTVL